ncbi:MAG: M48 family metalloprotease, partial [Deltaproteobacteria bacterium]|nr:M48 family metalloprotease [Deltaproteobacteria bacterium]
YIITSIVAQIVLGILASTIVMWFSRQREFRADGEGARLSGRHNMISALVPLWRVTDPQSLPEQMGALGISGGGKKWMRLFMTHPPLEERLQRLREAV